MADKNSKKDLEQLGQMMVNIYETGYMNRKQFYKMTFIRGIINGFGTVIGATIVVALLLWILSLFDNLPLIDGIVRSITNTVESTK